MKDNSYKGIFKSTSIFGGVQVINIIIAIFRSKIIAIFLGSLGMGIASLLNTTINLVKNITNFGLNSSSIRNVAEAYNSGNIDKLRRTVTIFKRLMWITGVLGTLLMLVFASFLSELTFGNGKYSMAFIALSITLLITQLTLIDDVLLRGLRKIRNLAHASMVGAGLGLIISAPLYYFWGIKGIVPSIIVTSIVGFGVNRFFTRKIKIEKVEIKKSDFKVEGFDMLKMGFVISLSNLITIGSSYVIRIYIRKSGSVDDVGLYAAGFAIIGTYVGMVFTAMATDYYPRLSMVASDNKKCEKEINQQAEIAILILAPILILFIVFVKWAIVFLYSHAFTGITSMIEWAALGMFFKAISWAIGFVFVAKGASGIYFWNELPATIYMLSLNMLGYHFFGLTGLGISYLISYFIHFVQMFIVGRRLYDFKLQKNLIRICSCQLLLLVACFVLVKIIPYGFNYIFGSICCIVSIWFSYNELNKLIGLKEIFTQKFSSKKS